MLRFRSLARMAALALLAPVALAACSGSAAPALIGSCPKVVATAAMTAWAPARLARATLPPRCRRSS
jgi:hypothetical protein